MLTRHNTPDWMEVVPVDPILDRLDDQTLPATHGMRLPLAVLAPVARYYINQEPTQRVQLLHRTFAVALLYRRADGGGAIILQTQDMRVLDMEYSDPEALDAEWRCTVKHYASGMTMLQDKHIA